MNEITKRINDSSWDDIIAHSVLTERTVRRNRTIKRASLSTGLLCTILALVTFTTINFNTGIEPGPINTQIYGTVSSVYEDDIYEEESTDLLIMTSLATR